MWKGEGVMERGESRGSEGGVLGPRHGLWVVVVGVHHHSWWWALDLPSAFLSRVTWPSTGRGGVTWRVLATNCQWAVDGGGAGLVGWVVIDVVRLLTISI